jgi:hypothetical protein
MRHLLHFGLFVFLLTAVTRADAQDRRRASPQTRVTVVATDGLRAAHPRQAYLQERQDLEEITRIARSWHRAALNGNRRAELALDRRLDAWLDREIRESLRTPRDHRYTVQIRALGRELATLDRGRRHGRSQVSHHGSHRSPGRYYERKAKLIDQLVELSEQRVRRAYATTQRPIRLPFAYR